MMIFNYIKVTTRTVFLHTNILLSLFTVFLCPNTVRCCNLDVIEKKTIINHFEKGVIHFNNYNFIDALIEFRNAEALQEKDENLDYMMGKTLLLFGAEQESIHYFKKAIFNNPDNVKAIIGLIDILGRPSTPDEENILINGSQDEVRYLLELKSNDQQYSNQLLKETMNKYPDNVEIIIYYARLMKKLNKTEEAERYYNIANSIDSSKADPNLHKYEVFIKAKEYKSALEYLLKLKLEHPTNIDYKFALYHLYMYNEETKDLNKAKCILEDLINIDTTNIPLYCELSGIAYQLQDAEAALRVLEKANTINIKSDLLYMNLGFYYYQNKQYHKSIEAYHKLLIYTSDKDDNYIVFPRLAELYLKVGNNILASEFKLLAEKQDNLNRKDNEYD